MDPSGTGPAVASQPPAVEERREEQESSRTATEVDGGDPALATRVQ